MPVVHSKSDLSSTLVCVVLYSIPRYIGSCNAVLRYRTTRCHGPISIWRTSFMGRSWDRFIFIMGFFILVIPQRAKFMRPTWGPPGSCRSQMNTILAPWTLLSGVRHLYRICMSLFSFVFITLCVHLWALLLAPYQISSDNAFTRRKFQYVGR